MPDHFVNIPNYSMLRNDRNIVLANGTIKHGGGLCTYIRQGINFNTMNELEICNDDIEMSEVKYNLPRTRKIYVLNVYKPPMGEIENCIEKIQQCLSTIRTNDQIDIFIGGDFNINVKQKKSPQYLKLSRFLKINQLKQYIEKTTRPDSDSSIDLLILNSEIIKESGSIDVNISDQLSQFILLEKKLRLIGIR